MGEVDFMPASPRKKRGARLLRLFWRRGRTLRLIVALRLAGSCRLCLMPRSLSSLDGDALGCGAFRPGDAQLQHAIAIARLGLVGIHAGRQRDATEEPAEL